MLWASMSWTAKMSSALQWSTMKHCDAALFEMSSANLSGGSFVGLTFAQSVDEVKVSGQLTDEWGIDDVYVIWADGTDRDADGYTNADGDCDDTDDSMNPDAIEVLTNGIDDDCDGVVDAGDLTVYTDYSEWSGDGGLFEEVINFESLSESELVDDDYEDLGAIDGTLEVVSVDGSHPMTSRGGMQ